MSIRNIGIFAHVDAGKTTLSEQLLFHAGAVREAGSVDSGTAHTDTLSVERRRGISVRSACVRLRWGEAEVNLIDTPGHTDFSAEIERSLWALDGAVIVVCAVEGVQPQTELLFQALRSQKLPVLFFINKTDREGADVDRVLGQIRRRLSDKAAPTEDADALLEAACDADDGLMERYLNGEEIPAAELRERFQALAREGRVHPVLSGSALRGIGISALLDAIVFCLPAPEPVSDSLCGVAFAAQSDRSLGKGLWVRLFGGKLENRDTVALPGSFDPASGENSPVKSKITQIRGVDGSDRGVLSAGEIGVVYGLGQMQIGQILGDASLLPRAVRAGALRSPVMTVRALPDKVEDMPALAAACMALSEEDPLLHARHVRATGELQLDVMGGIQLEILQETLQTRFGLSARFSEPTVIYRETIAREAEGFVKYVHPKPCWAVMRFRIRPGERGSGVRFHSEVPVRDLPMHYQHQVEQALPIALAQGRLGWRVTDVEITLVEGHHHLIHTHPLDFIVATPWGIHDGLERGGSMLLEPLLELNIRVPGECVGRVMSDVINMRGEVTSLEAGEDATSLTALVPAADSVDYAAALARLSSGRGSMSVRLHSYRECPMELGATAERRSVDPLDTSKYILAARSALEGGIFNAD